MASRQSPALIWKHDEIYWTSGSFGVSFVLFQVFLLAFNPTFMSDLAFVWEELLLPVRTVIYSQLSELYIFYVLLTAYLSIILDNDQIDTRFILQYVYYNPLHFSSIICSSSGSWIVLIQHLVSSRSVGGRPVHRMATYWAFFLLYLFL